ncbi:B12-binding domain-containing protein, partial [Acinetobacter baumannii]
LISGEVIPRMVALSRPQADIIDLAAQNPHISAADIDGLIPLVLDLDSTGLHERIDQLVARGVTNEALLIDLIAPLARRLGRLWEEDRCDFI